MSAIMSTSRKLRSERCVFLKSKVKIMGAGLAIGVISVVLVLLGNPANMGFCIACFVRDTTGALGLHKAETLQYIRPEVIGLTLGAFLIAMAKREFAPRGGSSPFTRFVLSFFVMIGALMFLGCPFRMILRLAGGDWNAILGLLGFSCGIGVGVLFLQRGYSLGRTHTQPVLEGVGFSIMQVVLFGLLAAAPAFVLFSVQGPAASHAPVWVSLLAGLVVGVLAQRTRLCMVGGIRDVLLFKDWTLLAGFAAVFAGALVCNLIFGFFQPGFANQPIAHTDGLWNFLGMLAVGLGSVLLGGCPMRQMVLAGEGNSDSAIAVLGLFAGAAAAHNLGLAASAKGPTQNGQVAVVLALGVMLVVALVNTYKAKK